MPVCYSYLRWSSHKQKKGDTYDRQVELRDDFLKRHPELTLSETTYIDQGKSAYTGRNVGPGGELRGFITAVTEGRIAHGSWLIVESIDRMSRVKPLQGRKLFTEIIELGITIQTLVPEQTLSLDIINDDWTKLLFVDALLARANEESDTKRRRTVRGRSKKIRLWNEGGPDRKIITSICPGWLVPNATKTGFHKIPDKVSVVEQIFELAQIHGLPTIARKLNDQKLVTFGPLRKNDKGKQVSPTSWSIRTVHKVLVSKAVCGVFESDKKPNDPTRPDDIVGHYPVIITPEVYEQANSAMKNRKWTGGTTDSRKDRLPDTINLLAGSLFCTCGARSLILSAKNVRGKMYRYALCDAAFSKAGCEQRRIRYPDIEAFVLAYFKNKLALILSKVVSKKVDDPRVKLEQERDKQRIRLDRLYEIGSYTEGKDPVLLEKIREIQAGMRKLTDQIHATVNPAAQRAALIAAAGLVAKLDPKRLDELTREERLRVRVAIKHLVKRVQCWIAHDGDRRIKIEYRGYNPYYGELPDYSLDDDQFVADVVGRLTPKSTLG